MAGMITITSEKAHLQMGECERMLILLNARTWCSGQTSDDFGLEVACAMKLGVEIMLAHEMPSFTASHGTRPTMRQAGDRFGCEFGEFFVHTPGELLLNGIYGTLAIPMMGGEVFRATSMEMLAEATIKDSFMVKPCTQDAHMKWAHPSERGLTRESELHHDSVGSWGRHREYLPGHQNDFAMRS